MLKEFENATKGHHAQFNRTEADYTESSGQKHSSLQHKIDPIQRDGDAHAIPSSEYHGEVELSATEGTVMTIRVPSPIIRVRDALRSLDASFDLYDFLSATHRLDIAFSILEDCYGHQNIPNDISQFHADVREAVRAANALEHALNASTPDPAVRSVTRRFKRLSTAGAAKKQDRRNRQKKVNQLPHNRGTPAKQQDKLMLRYLTQKDLASWKTSLNISLYFHEYTRIAKNPYNFRCCPRAIYSHLAPWTCLPSGVEQLYPFLPFMRKFAECWASVLLKPWDSDKAEPGTYKRSRYMSLWL